MAEGSLIEWCDDTHNDWIGCTKKGPGCLNCYAEADFDLRRHVAQWGRGKPRVRTSEANRKRLARMNKQPFCECADCGWRGPRKKAVSACGHEACPKCNGQHLVSTRRRVFCHSLSDVFDAEVPVEWLTDLFRRIRETPNIDYILLTKRIDEVARRTEAAGGWPATAALAITVVNQSEVDRGVPTALMVKAALGIECLMLSVEPLLGPVDLERVSWPGKKQHRVDVLRGGYWNKAPYMFGSPSADLGEPKGGFTNHSDFPATVDGVIVGFESGPNARCGHPDWVRALRDQCEAAQTPFMFKQWGTWSPEGESRVQRVITLDGRVCDFTQGAMHQLEREAPLARATLMKKRHKKLTGRLLDGREHMAMPRYLSSVAKAAAHEATKERQAA